MEEEALESAFAVKLDQFSGPLDLLLFLVRKHELDIMDIPVALITEQYLAYLDVLKELNIDDVGNFIVIASILIEIKSFQVLPGEQEVEEEIEDPRKELVTRLLAYKKFCEGAGRLEKRGRLWQRRYPRLASDLPPKERDVASEPIQNVVVWDLVSAFGRILREKSPQMKQTIVYDDTPISVHMQRIYNRLKREKTVPFSSFFQNVHKKGILIGLFLAMLELVRHEYAYAEQSIPFGDIEIRYRESSRAFDFASVDEPAPPAENKPENEPAAAAEIEPAIKPEILSESESAEEAGE